MEYIAKVTIRHRRQDRPQGLAPEPAVDIPSGTKFDPDAIGMAASEVLRLLARGHISAPEDPNKEAPPQPSGVTITGESQRPHYGFGRTNIYEAVDKAIERNKESN